MKVEVTFIQCIRHYVLTITITTYNCLTITIAKKLLEKLYIVGFCILSFPCQKSFTTIKVKILTRIVLL